MRVVVIGVSGGIGAALARALDTRGAKVIGLSRTRDGLELTDPESIARVAARTRDRLGPGGAADMILAATGALEISGRGPEKSLAAVEADAMAAQFAVNAIGPALLLRHFAPLLPREGRSVFAILSARVGSIGDNRLGGWISYRAAKAALNQIIRTAAIEMARTRPEALVVALHPGTVESALTAKYLGRHAAVTPDVAARSLLGVVDGLGAADTGGFFDWRGERVPW